MKIIKEGNLSKLHKTKRFECKKCGCIFECEKGEYDVEDGYRNDTYISVDCPTCNHHIILG